MSNVQKELLNKINTILENVLYEAGHKIFFEAKSTVPNKTGKLKGTGTISKLAGGFKITFGGDAAPYGGIVEDGREEQAFSSTSYRYNVRAHKRKTSDGQTNVKAHTVDVVGMRRGLTDSGWITVQKMPELKGTRFLKNARDKMLQSAIRDGLKKLPKQITIRV